MADVMENIELYNELLSMCGDIRTFLRNYPLYKTQLSFSVLNKDCYFKIYKELEKPISRPLLFDKIENLQDECKACWAFYMPKRTKSIIGLDVQLGKKFQEKLIDFLRTKGINCEKGDVKDKRYPDNAVLNKKNEISAYFEVKYQSSPWLTAYQKSKPVIRECYEASPALDIKKFEQQRKLIADGAIQVPVYYVYWMDLPCVKGIFYLTADEVSQSFYENAPILRRKEKEGDIPFANNADKEKRLSKIHLSILKMKDFSSLIEEFRRAG